MTVTRVVPDAKGGLYILLMPTVHNVTEAQCYNRTTPVFLSEGCPHEGGLVRA